MAVTVIDTIKPKNNGTFPVAEAADIAVTGSQRLPAALNAKANQSDLNALSNTVSNKADQSALNTTNAAVATKANQSALDTTNANLALKADQSALDSTNATVAAKANTADVNSSVNSLQAQIDAIVTPVTQDAEVETARVGADGTSYASLKTRLDTEQVETLNPFNRVPTEAHNTAIDAISDFVIYMKDPSKDVTLKLVYKNYSNVYAVAIVIDNTTYNILNVTASQYNEKSYNKFDLGDVGYGYFIINWNAISGSQYWNINTKLKQIFKKQFVENKLLPFDSVDDVTNNTAVKAISDFVIHLNDPSESVKLKTVYRNYEGTYTNVYAVAITIGTTTYNVLNKAASQYAETSYNEFDLGDKGYGYFVIDWNAVESGASYYNIFAELKQTYKKSYNPLYRDVEILLPEVVYVTVGKEISLEYYNIVKCSNIDEYQVEVTGINSQLQNLGTRLRIAPTSTWTVNETIRILKNSVVVAEKNFQIKAIADSQPTIKAMFLGDSMTNAGIYISELVNMLGADKITLYGTRSIAAIDSEGNSRTIYHEGRGSWSTDTYVHEASFRGLTNPFYNDGFDFNYYMTNNPTFADVTDVFILLGTNDMAGDNIEENYSAICSSIKEFNSSIRIHCMLPPPPVKDGYAFGKRNYFNYLTFKNYMFNTGKKIKTLFDGVSGYSIIPIHANLDCWYDFPQTEVSVNSRNPQQVTVLNDNVHPSKYGYYRYADAIYGDIVAYCQ